MRGGTLRRENSTRGRRVLPGVRQRNAAQPQLMKDRDEIEILAQRFGPFHREKQSDLSRALRPLDLGKTAAKRQARSGFDFRLEQRDLVQHDPEPLFPEILVLDVNGKAKQTNVTRFKFRQKIRRDDIPAWPTQKETERQIEMKIDQLTRVERSDSLFDLIARSHGAGNSLKMAPAAASFAPPLPSLATTPSKSVTICLRRSGSSSRRSTSAAIASGFASPWMNSGTISRFARTLGIPRCFTRISIRPTR